MVIHSHMRSRNDLLLSFYSEIRGCTSWSLRMMVYQMALKLLIIQMARWFIKDTIFNIPSAITAM